MPHSTVLNNHINSLNFPKSHACPSSQIVRLVVEFSPTSIDHTDSRYTFSKTGRPKNPPPIDEFDNLLPSKTQRERKKKKKKKETPTAKKQKSVVAN